MDNQDDFEANNKAIFKFVLLMGIGFILLATCLLLLTAEIFFLLS